MEIYKSEIDAGLEESIKTQASLAYTAEIIVDNVTVVPPTEDAPGYIEASVSDLFPMNSILATSTTNLNDDDFTGPEMWAAKDTPVDKPFNMEHSQRDIIGHITASYPVDADLNPIPLDTPVDQLPDLFHLMTSAVIYKSYPDDPEFEATIANIIDEIKQGQWFVSMECLFQGFDYSIQAADGSKKVIARDENTAYLTKHLRAYGGTGTYDGNKIVRVLKNITFSGKGLVRRPANPSSAIFPPMTKINNVAATMVYSNNESEPSNILPENHTMDLQEQINKLEAALAKVTGEKEAAIAKLAEVNISSYQSKATELASVVEAKDSEIVTLKAKVSDLEAAVTEAAERIVSAEKDKKDLQDNFDKMKKDKTKSERKSKLIAANYSEEAAESLLAAFENVDDAAFEGVVMLAQKAGSVNLDTPNSTPVIPVTSVKTPQQYVQEAIRSASKSASPQINTSQATSWEDVLNNLEAVDESATASVASEEVSAVESTRASIAEYMLKKGVGSSQVKKTK